MAYAYRSRRKRGSSYGSKSRRRTTTRRRTYGSYKPRRRATRTRRRSVNRRSGAQTLRIVIEQPGTAPAGFATQQSLAALGEVEKPAKKAKLGSNA